MVFFLSLSVFVLSVVVTLGFIILYLFLYMIGVKQSMKETVKDLMVGSLIVIMISLIFTCITGTAL